MMGVSMEKLWSHRSRSRSQGSPRRSLCGGRNHRRSCGWSTWRAMAGAVGWPSSASGRSQSWATRGVSLVLMPGESLARPMCWKKESVTDWINIRTVAFSRGSSASSLSNAHPRMDVGRQGTCRRRSRGAVSPRCGPGTNLAEQHGGVLK